VVLPAASRIHSHTVQELVHKDRPWQDLDMAPDTLSGLLKLSPAERAELAMALWESLDEPQRQAEFPLSPEQAAELDRRFAEHLANPASSIPWAEVRRKLGGGA
jgi:putative addiction module component (TIGR02574 family)